MAHGDGFLSDGCMCQYVCMLVYVTVAVADQLAKVSEFTTISAAVESKDCTAEVQANSGETATDG